MLWFSKGNNQAKVKHNVANQQIEIARGPNLKLHGTCDGKVLNLKLTRIYFFKENKTYS